MFIRLFCVMMGCFSEGPVKGLLSFRERMFIYVHRSLLHVNWSLLHVHRSLLCEDGVFFWRACQQSTLITEESGYVMFIGLFCMFIGLFLYVMRTLVCDSRVSFWRAAKDDTDSWITSKKNTHVHTHTKKWMIVLLTSKSSLVSM